MSTDFGGGGGMCRCAGDGKCLVNGANASGQHWRCSRTIRQWTSSRRLVWPWRCCCCCCCCCAEWICGAPCYSCTGHAVAHCSSVEITDGLETRVVSRPQFRFRSRTLVSVSSWGRPFGLVLEARVSALISTWRPKFRPRYRRLGLVFSLIF